MKPRTFYPSYISYSCVSEIFSFVFRFQVCLAFGCIMRTNIRPKLGTCVCVLLFCCTAVLYRYSFFFFRRWGAAVSLAFSCYNEDNNTAAATGILTCSTVWYKRSRSPPPNPLRCNAGKQDDEQINLCKKLYFHKYDVLSRV